MKRLLSCVFIVIFLVTCFSIPTSAASYAIDKTIDVTRGQLANGRGLGLPVAECECPANTFTCKLVSGKNVVRITYKDDLFNVRYRKTGTGTYKLTCKKGHTIYVRFIVRPFEITGTHNTNIAEAPEELAIRDWYVNTKTAVVPSKVDGFKVTVIQPKCFSNNDKIEVIKIPSSVKYIQKSAFDDCENLKKVIINGKTFTKKTLYKIWLPSTWKGYSHGITEVPEYYSIYSAISDGEPSKPLYEYFS